MIKRMVRWMVDPNTYGPFSAKTKLYVLLIVLTLIFSREVVSSFIA